MDKLLNILSEINDKITKIERKLDKNTNLLTKIAKVLHLIPVTEKEERAFQITQRTNLQIAAKVNDELEQMSNSDTKNGEYMSLFAFPQYPYSDADVFGDVLADDYLGGSD